MPSRTIDDRARSKLEAELADVYSQRPITDPTRFSGRAELLDFCRSQLLVPGMSFAVYGDRGIGKTSFVNVLLADKNFMRRTAEANMGFDRLLAHVMSALGEAWTPTERRASDKATVKGTVKAPLAELGNEVSTEHGETYQPVMPASIDFDFVADALARRAKDVDAIVIEEFHRLPAESRRSTVQLMKVLADRGVDLRVIAVGITEWGQELMADREYKDYIGRNIVAIRLSRMTSAELSDIIARREAAGVRVPEDVAADLIWVAAGYPALVHRVMFDATATWIRANTQALVVAAVGVFAGVLGAVSGLPGIGLSLAELGIKGVSLKKVDARVGRPNLEAALTRFIAIYEEQEIPPHGYEQAAGDPKAKKMLDAYMLSDDDDFRPETAAAQAGLSAGTARRAWTQTCGILFGPTDKAKPPAGFRSYLRARRLLATKEDTSPLSTK
jgi:Cdc6-like AAA superfamily ATPase